MYCHNCGKQIPDDTKFCHYCGAAQTAPGQPESMSAAGAPSPGNTPSPEPAVSAKQQDAYTWQEQAAPPAPEKKKSKGPVVAVVIAAIVGFALLSRFVIVPAFLGSTGEASKIDGGAAQLADYTPPEFLGDDPLTFIFELNGARYQLPAPLSAFTEKGWELVPEYEDSLPDVVEQGLYFPGLLRKGNEMCHVLLKNYADQDAPLETCPVVEIGGFNESQGTQMKIPEGFTWGMDWDTMMGIIEPSDTMYYQANVLEGFYTEWQVYTDPDGVVRDEDGWVTQYNCDYVSIHYSYQYDLIYGFTIHAETLENDRPRPDFDPAPGVS